MIGDDLYKLETRDSAMAMLWAWVDAEKDRCLYIESRNDGGLSQYTVSLSWLGVDNVSEPTRYSVRMGGCSLAEAARLALLSLPK